MKKTLQKNGTEAFICIAVLTVVSFIFNSNMHAEDYPAGYSDYKKSIEVSAIVQDEPAQIKLVWRQLLWNGNFEIYRRTSGPNTTWGSPRSVLPHDTTEYIDTDVILGTEYEYRIIKENAKANGYIRTGIKIPLKDIHGKIIFLIESSIASSMANELKLMEKMMVADGWQVVRAEVSTNDSVVSVKTVIQDLYNQDPINTKALYLFGNIPVPYSGKMAPDMHGNHKGAWPADVFYADIDGVWTDTSVNITTASHDHDQERNYNIPGDGKYDQNFAPTAVELQMGRVDLSKLPCMGNEIDLLKNYINKNYNYRYKLFSMDRRGAVRPGFDGRDEAISADAFRECAAFFGQGKTTLVEPDLFFDTLSSGKYLWACAQGGGSFTSATNVGESSDIKAKDPQAVFYTLCGSWFGDWDPPKDNFLRSFIASDTYGLTSIWAGVTHWFAQDMGLGYNIGYAVKLYHNNLDDNDKGYTLLVEDNSFDINTSNTKGKTEVALMGDPTLRLHTVYPVSNLAINESYTLSWTASIDTDIVGYHIYKAANELGHYTRLTNEAVAATFFTDPSPTEGGWYMVRTVKLEVSGSGSYYNPSQGIMVQASGPVLPDTEPPANTVNLEATFPTSSTINLSWTAPGDDGNTGVATAYDIRISQEPITEETFIAASQVLDIPAPQIAGTTQSMSVNTLEADTTYYFAIKTSDEVPNTSTMSNIATATTTAPPPPADTEAPGTITDLTATAPTASSITINWTAPGDDGNIGTATSYDIRISQEPITEDNFNIATQLVDIPAPQEAGNNESMLVEGLLSNTTYYFAIKTNDEVPNLSLTSNIAQVTTLIGVIGNEGWIDLNGSMLFYECGNEYISLFSLIDEQGILADDPVDGSANPASTTFWKPDWGEVPVIIVALGDKYNISKIAMLDYWGNTGLNIQYWDGTQWIELATWDLSYANKWRIIEAGIITDKLRFEFDGLGGKIGEIGIKGELSDDIIAPAAITNLSSINTTRNRIDLSWTSTGDDGNAGTSTGYDIRISQSPITEDNFSAATQISNEIIPVVAGGAQSIFVEGLNTYTTYYFAVKAFDEVGNASPVSNIINATTMEDIGGNTAQWLTLESSMLSYEAGTISIPLSKLVDEQSILSIEPVDGGISPATTSFWSPTWGEVPTFVIDLGGNYNVKTIALQDHWGSSDLNVQYWNGLQWNTLFTWDMSYSNKWKVIEVDINASKIRFIFSSLGSKIGEIGIKAIVVN